MNDADNGLFCKGTAPDAPFDRGFGEGDDRVLGFAFAFAGFEEERRGDLGGEGWILDTGGDSTSASTSIASSFDASRETDEGFLDLCLLVGLGLSSSPAFPFANEVIESLFLWSFTLREDDAMEGDSSISSASPSILVRFLDKRDATRFFGSGGSPHLSCAHGMSLSLYDEESARKRARLISVCAHIN